MSTFRRSAGGAVVPNSTTIKLGYVAPSAVAPAPLTGGGCYSLNKRSNVPYVTIRGASGYLKTISWGEIAEVPKGQNFVVQNASYHGGDIILNFGEDACNRPSRISVPVSYARSLEVSAGQFYWRADFPCDVRAAKRAYLQMDAYLIAGGSQSRYVTVRGRRLDGSMKTENQLQRLTTPFGPGVGYFDVHELSASSVITIPLGKNAPLGDDSRPHMLLDNADAFFFAQSDFQDFAWPVSEIPNFPSVSNTPFPSVWYVVEYD